MKKSPSSIDGFIPRRPGGQLGDLHDVRRPEKLVRPVDRALHSHGNQANDQVGRARSGRGIGRDDIDASLKNIEEGEKGQKLSRRSRRQLKRDQKFKKHGRSKVKKVFAAISVMAVLAVIATAGYFALQINSVSGNVFKGKLLDIVKNEPLKQDANGYSNFLVLGTSEDDPGHPGGNLTDSMMVVSVNQTTKQAYIFSIPRDLYIQYGQACVSGYQGKINVYFSCVSDENSQSAENERLAKTQALVGDIFGLDIQYGVHVNNSVIKDAVDAVGGVDVNIQGDGASGILDRNFDWRCKYTCYYVKYDNGVHHLDGDHALFLAMARGDVAPTYGLANSNFDREQNQQKILLALKEKAVSTGTLTNLSAISKLISAFGDNFRSNIPTSQVATLAQLGQSVKPADIHQVNLYGGNDSVVTTGPYNGQSVVMPATGIFDYTGMQSFIAEQMSGKISGASTTPDSSSTQSVAN